MFGFFNKKVFDKGWLSPEEGHEVYYQQIGNPQGEPVLFFHGGPGGCCKISHADCFNVKKQRIIMFDQRGCGQSKAEDAFVFNDTKRLLKDAKRLLDHLNIKDKITIAGVSWGSTLALLFAERYPNIVKELCVYSIFLANRDSINWMLKDSSLFYPDLLEEIYSQSEGVNPYTYYAKMIFSEDLSAIQTAIKYMANYERILGRTDAKFEDTRIDNNAINSCRISLYYAANKYFLDDDEILKNADKLKNIPTFIFHNRLDMCCPIRGAWSLYRALKNAKIEIIADRGHGGKMLKKAVRKHFS